MYRGAAHRKLTTHIPPTDLPSHSPIATAISKLDIVK
jgi:hypothetical protein